VSDLEPDQLRKVIEDGVFRGTSKAIAVYCLVTGLIALVYYIIANS